MEMKEFTMQEFAEQVKAIIEKSLSGIKEVHIQNVLKNNSVKLTGLVILSKESNVAPNIYLESYYERYKNGTELEILVHEIIRQYRIGKCAEKINLGFILDWEEAKKMVAYKVINREKNEELLVKTPHRDVLDLSKVCYLSLNQGDGSILIHKQLFDMWHIDEEELFQTAEKNTPRLFPPSLKSVHDVVCELWEEGFGEEAKVSADCQIGMYLLTNKQKHTGAGVIFYDGILKDMAQAFGGDFYILPSSTHEVIILPVVEGGSAEELAEMVKEINAAMVDKEEILSNHVYCYKRETKELYIAA